MRRRRAGLAAAGAAALITPTAVTAGPAAAAMRLPAGQAARAGLAAVATAAWPGASRQALAGPRSQLPVFVLDKGQFRAFDIPFGEFGGDSVTINDRGQIAGSYYDDLAATCLRGFLRDRNGRFTRIDFPVPGTTQLLDVNDRGQIAGSYRPSAGGACSDTVPLRGFRRPCVPVSLTRSVCRAGLGEAEPDGPDLIPANRTGAQMRESWRPGGDTLRRSGRLEANLPHISHTRSSSRLHRAGVA
jgi:hypothetical protein